MTQKSFLLSLLFIASGISPCRVMGIDKQKAIAGRRRISEKTLLTVRLFLK
jgi:uncharacterized membrane protein YsdA (DUF1294 family)